VPVSTSACAAFHWEIATKGEIVPRTWQHNAIRKMREFLENCIVASCGHLEGSIRVGNVNRLGMSFEIGLESGELKRDGERGLCVCR
jgi:hypothetical protein